MDSDENREGIARRSFFGIPVGLLGVPSSTNRVSSVLDTGHIGNGSPLQSSSVQLIQTSFEDESVGAESPNEPFYLFKNNGLHEVVEDESSDGDQAFQTGNAPLGDPSAFAIDFDLTNYDNITLDVFTVSNNPNFGNIKISLDGAGFGNSKTNIWDFPNSELNPRGYSNYRDVEQWYYDCEVDLSDYDGERTVAFWVDGDNNAIWDNIKINPAEDTGDSVEVRPKIREKENRISALRTEIEKTIDDGVVPDNLSNDDFFLGEASVDAADEDAEAFINELEDQLTELSDKERRQYREALERLVSLEDISVAAAENPNKTVFSVEGEDPTIIEQTADSVVSGALILATVGLFKAAKSAGRIGVGSRLAGSLVDDIAAHARSLKNTLISSGFINSSTSSRLASAFTAIKSRFATVFSNNTESIKTAFEESGLTATEVGLDALVPEGLQNTLSELLSGAKQVIAKILYEYYIFSTDIIDIEIPTSDSIEEQIPTVDVPTVPDEISLPDDQIERLYEFVRGKNIDITDSIDISFLSNQIPDEIDVDLSEVDGLEGVASVSDIIDGQIRGTTVSGVDPSIDNGVRELEVDISEASLEESDDSDRETVETLLSGGIAGITSIAQVVLSVLNFGNAFVGVLLLAVVIGTLIVLLGALPTWGASLAALPYLGTAAVALGATAKFIVGASIITGVGYLIVADKIHEGGTRLLANDELGEVI